jgi:hypothetical protein
MVFQSCNWLGAAVRVFKDLGFLCVCDKDITCVAGARALGLVEAGEHADTLPGRRL